MTQTGQDRFATLAALRPARKRAAFGVSDEPRGMAPQIPEGSTRLAELLGARPVRNRFGEHLALRRWFSEPIGGDPPESNVDQATLRLLAPEAHEDVADPRQWLFLDTETTGLAGGTGTYAFLVGIAWWDAGGLEVEQFFMRDHSEEHSLLVALAERMAERRVLVTFNGKCFDWPLLETRYRMTRTIRPPAPHAHLDFLHPARNLWRLRLGSVRLPELERHVLGWNRGVDVESELIPAIYFDFLRGGRPEPWSRSFSTIRRIYADWPGSPNACFPFLPIPLRLHATLSSSSASRAFASGAAKLPVLGNSMNNRSRLSSPANPRASPGELWRGWQRKTAISESPVTPGRSCSGVRETASKPTKSLPFTSSAAPASLNALPLWCAEPWRSCERQVAGEPLRRQGIAAIGDGSSGDWRAWKERLAVRCSVP